jgi:biopolymer transport protein ExbB/TolQ
MDHPSKKDMIKLRRFPDRAIKWIGSVTSLVIHTILFISSFLLSTFHFVEFAQMLLVLTTIVSLEAIYLSIFIQMSVNRSNQYIEIIHEDVDEISENVDEISENIDEMQKEDEEEDEDDIKESEVLDTIKETLLMLQKEVISLRKSRNKK